MNGLVEAYGIIIKVMPIGEYDKRITLLTKEYGKISAFARGARRQGSPFMGITRVFATGRFRLYEGRDSYTLNSAVIDNYFEEITEDVERTCYGSYFLELADYYARDYLSDPEMISLLYLTLTALCRPALPDPLVRRVYELRLMAIGGVYDAEPRLPVSETCRYAWNYILTTPLEKLYTFVLSDEVFRELAGAVDEMMERYIDRPMHSLEILKVMTEGIEGT